MSNRAWVTLATNDSYGLGALVLAHSLRRAGSAYPAVVLITPSVTEAMRDRLSAVFAEVVTVDVLDSGDAAHLALLQRPELGITFTKIHCWNLTQFDKCVFLDADTLVVQNCDELFEREELSAAPDVGWPDCFNSGVFVFRPSAETFSGLIKFAQERGSFDGGDQGLLNSYFSDWAHGDINKHLPFLYNVTSAAFYSYLPALKHYGQNLKIIHFIGAAKPWLQQFNWETRSVDAPEHLREMLQLWWDLFVSQVHSQLDTAMVEVEEVPTSIAPPQETIFYHTEPMSDYNNYKPLLDPDSEFHWHRPDAQIPYTEIIVPEIDMTQFHDPWDIYRGRIRPLTEEAKSTSSYSLNLNEQQELRKHVWEQPASQQFIHHIEEPHYAEPPYAESHYTPMSPSETHYNKVDYIATHNNELYHKSTNYNEFYHNSSHNNEFHEKPTNQNEIHHISSNQNENWETGTSFDQSKSFSAETHHFQHPQDSSSQSEEVQFNRNYDFHQNQFHENFADENCSHHTDIQSIYNNNYDRSSFCNNSIVSSRNESIIHNNREYDVSQISDRFKSESDRRQESHLFHQHYTPIPDYHSNNSQHEFSYSSQSKEQEVNSASEENPNDNTDFGVKSFSNNTEFNSVPVINKNRITSHHSQKLPQDFIHSLRSKVEYVYCLYLDHERERNRQREKLRGTTDATQAKVNGFDLETEINDDDDFIIPRHPYDGFYLRHKMTIDSRGRKICTHEIPPTPSPSLSPPGSPVYFDAISESSSPEDTVLETIGDEHSGVAGNLARVSPDPSGLQREALDELSRRQGWEAGNIDYMGADSFDNIWAKISQTLSQPPASPPKETSPQQVVASEAKESEVSSPLPAEIENESPIAAEQPKESSLVVDESNKVEVAAEAVALLGSPGTADAPVPMDSSAPADVTVSADAPASVDAPVPVVAPVPAAALAPAEALALEDVPTPADAPVLADASASADVPAPADAPVSEDAPGLADAPALVDATAPAVAPATVVAPAPADISAPVGAPAPAVAPAPSVAPAAVVAPVPAVAPAPAVASAPAEAPATAPLEGAEKPLGEASQESAVPVKLAESSTQDVKPAPVVAPAAIEALISDNVVSEEALIPVETADIPAESSVSELPSEIPVPVVEAVLAEVKAPVDDSSIKPEEVPTPVIEASVQDVPKEESSSTTSTRVVQQKKSGDDSLAPKEVSPKEAISVPIAPEAPKPQAVVPSPESPAAEIKIPSTPTKAVDLPAASDSPPLANTPSTEEIPTEASAKAEERRKPAGKLQLHPPAAADPLPTPDSELEDAAALAQSIIASELRTPTVTSPSPPSPASPAQPKLESRLAAEEPQPPTPPVGSVSLSQIGVKAAKGKSTIAAQIESSVAAKPAPATPTAEPKAPTDAPKKKLVKKVLKKDIAASGEAPVPPPRKKEKKPKEK